LIAAERRVAAAFYQSEDARLARLPSFTLNAQGGYSSLTNAIGQLSAGMYAPLYTGGLLEGQVDIATADQKAAIAAYGQTLLNAFQEVENALANGDLFAKREKYLEKAVAENERALQKVQAQFKVGRIDLLSVLQIQARVLGARSALIAVRNERLAQRVNLHLALGGSFGRPDPP
jgi:outer membrane protein TolC